ncbi:Hypothetical predicted protein [Pelobates cultripes]|uniref:Uncharacterized protein n=1 Tax=Pelobates cultripes TaxID=61616 RepID=A0AAD1W6E4_PELCU|nr:Hypothetical predicted protein [Pelobates cultripes]
MTYCYEGDAYITEVKRRLVEYGPDPSEEVIGRIMQELDLTLHGVSTTEATYAVHALCQSKTAKTQVLSLQTSLSLNLLELLGGFEPNGESEGEDFPDDHLHTLRLNMGRRSQKPPLEPSSGSRDIGTVLQQQLPPKMAEYVKLPADPM